MGSEKQIATDYDQFCFGNDAGDETESPSSKLPAPFEHRAPLTNSSLAKAPLPQASLLTDLISLREKMANDERINKEKKTSELSKLFQKRKMAEDQDKQMQMFKRMH